MKIVEVPTYTATIYLGGDYDQAVIHARDYCDEVGLCVTVSRTKYVYTGGETDGVAIGLINYGRFPAEPGVIFDHARALALRLLIALGQDSASIVASDRTMWMSKRPDDISAQGALTND